MDQTIRDLIVGVASSGLWSVLAEGGVRTARRLREHRSNSDAITEHLQNAVDSIVEHFALGAGQEREKLMNFLRSPELEAIVRQLYACRLVAKDEEVEGTTSSIRREFLSLISVHVDIGPERLQNAANLLFHALVTACNASLTRTIGHGKSGAHEALSQYRHRRLLDELAVIDRNIAMLSSMGKTDVTSILAFEEKYRRQVGVRHSFIQPPHFDAAKKVPIENLFVTPKFWSPSRPKSALRMRSDEVELQPLLRSLYRLVILGNPGGGKSTFATKIVHDMATRYNARPVADRLLSPALVELREYGRLKKSLNCSVLQFIETQANSNYQVQPPDGAFEYLLLNGHVFVVFDGLDELLDTGYRQEISADVESFCALYPNVPVLVTSREVGYDQAPLDPRMFPTLRIAPFDLEQVEQYSQKWFGRDEDYPEKERQQKAQAFLVESGVAPDLRSNPLMLGLMCNLYKVEGYIPRNRADVYEKCSIMLFERWDKGRGILVHLPFEAHVRPAMQHLAFWIYADESLQTGVTRGNLVEQTTDFLATWVFDQGAEARFAANEFVDFCTGRAWVFTDTGTTADGEKLYQFTHRTFLEYFAASYLVSIHPTPDALVQVLLPRIRKQEWDVVAILAFQIQSRRVQGGADSLLKSLIEEAPLAERAACISFAGRCLDSIVPSPKIRRDIAWAAVDLAVRVSIEGCDLRSTTDTPARRKAPAVMVLAPILSASIENRPTLAAVLKERLTSMIAGTDDPTSLAALEIALLPGTFTMRSHPATAVDNAKFWRDTFAEVVTGDDPRIRQLAKSDWNSCIALGLKGLLPIEELIRWHGPSIVFKKRTWRCTLGRAVPMSSVLITRLFVAAIGETSLADAGIEEVPKLGRCLLNCDVPWVRSTEQSAEREERFWDALPYYRADAEQTIESHKSNSFSPDELFGAFCLLAVRSELNRDRPLRDPDQLLRVLKSSNLVLAARMAVARSMPMSWPKLLKLTTRCGFDAAQTDFVRRWIEGDLSFTDAGAGAQLQLLTLSALDVDEIDLEDIDSDSDHVLTE
jgi:hypothetical protein